MVDPQALIQQYQNEIAELKALLREKEVIGSEHPVTSRGEVRDALLVEEQRLICSVSRMKRWKRG